MNIRYQAPCPALRGLIRTFYYFATEEPAAHPLCAELGNIRILLAGGGSTRLPGEAPVALLDAALIGPTSGAYLVDAEAGTRVFGVGVLPRGWGAFLGVSAEEMADRTADADAVMGPALRRLAEAIRNAQDFGEMVVHAERYFLDLVSRRAGWADGYPAALEQWLTSPDDKDLSSLLAMMDVSRRQTDRLAKRFFGASPKLLQRKYRALRAADRMGDGGTWLEAAGGSFYDQSHFIKEFKTFIGVTPADYAKQAGLIQAYRAERRRALRVAPLGNL